MIKPTREPLTKSPPHVEINGLEIARGTRMNLTKKKNMTFKYQASNVNSDSNSSSDLNQKKNKEQNSMQFAINPRSTRPHIISCNYTQTTNNAQN